MRKLLSIVWFNVYGNTKAAGAHNEDRGLCHM